MEVEGWLNGRWETIQLIVHNGGRREGATGAHVPHPLFIFPEQSA